MCVAHVFRLVGIQLQIFNSVITWIFVYMVDYFLRFKISSDVLLHNVSVLKNVFQVAWLVLVSRVRMIVGSDNQDITITANFASTFPARGFVFALTVHGIVFSLQSLAVHRIVFAGNIAMIRGVGVCEVFCCSGAAFGTVRAGLRKMAPSLFTANGAFDVFAFDFCGTGAIA